jgi:hypothetical protein
MPAGARGGREPRQPLRHGLSRIHSAGAEPTTQTREVRSMASEQRASPIPNRGTSGRGRLRQLTSLVADLERRAGDGAAIGGTALTTLKLTGSPLARLADRGRIGLEELRAADDIVLAFFAIAGGLMIRPVRMERQDRGYCGFEPAFIIDAQTRYRAFAEHWSRRAKRNDPTLAIVIAASVDERPFTAIDQDFRLRHGKAAAATVAGLRDYAARARWVDARLAQEWIEAAASIFPLRRRKA